MEDRFFFEMSFAPSMQLVSHVREFTTNFYEELLENQEAISRLGVATHELLENAVRHSSDSITKMRVAYLPDSDSIEIRTWNRLSPKDSEPLRQRMNALARASDPQVHYQELLRQSIQRTEGSGLGLGRIWAEADFSVTYEIDDQQVVCVIAKSAVTRNADLQGRKDA